MNTNMNKITAQRIATARHERNLSQADLAMLISEVSHRDTPLTVASVSSWESGRRMPSIEMFVALEKVLGIKKEYLQGLTNSKDGSTEEEITQSPVITKDMLPDYHEKPIYVEFNNYTHADQWGIYDNHRKVIVFTKGCLNISDPSIKRFLSMEQHYYGENIVYAKKPLTLHKLLQFKFPVYVEMKTNDAFIQGRYNGWYKHNEDHSALVNSIGLVLPYEGVDISYDAYGSPMKSK